MKNVSIHKLALCIGAIFGILLVVNIILSLRAYNSSKDIEKQFISLKRSLQQANGPESNDIREKDTPPVLSGGNKETILSLSDELINVKEIIESTGLELLAENSDIAPETLQSMVDNYLENEDLELRMQDNREIASEQIKDDIYEYGEKFNDLLQRSRRNIIRGDNNEGRVKAIAELIEDYPYSYVTARIVFSQAFQYAKANAIDQAEERYETLLDIQDTKSGRIMLANGMEAAPNAGLGLAWAYFRTGRIDDSKEIIMALEDNYPDSLYSIKKPGRRNESMMATSQEAFSVIRNAIENSYD